MCLLLFAKFSLFTIFFLFQVRYYTVLCSSTRLYAIFVIVTKPCVANCIVMAADERVVACYICYAYLAVLRLSIIVIIVNA
jgi:hypothetical protein